MVWGLIRDHLAPRLPWAGTPTHLRAPQGTPQRPAAATPAGPAGTNLEELGETEFGLKIQKIGKKTPIYMCVGVYIYIYTYYKKTQSNQ